MEKKLIFGRAVQEPAGNAKNPVIPNCCIECETSKLVEMQQHNLEQNKPGVNFESNLTGEGLGLI